MILFTFVEYLDRKIKYMNTTMNTLACKFKLSFKIKF